MEKISQVEMKSSLTLSPNNEPCRDLLCVDEMISIKESVFSNCWV